MPIACEKRLYRLNRVHMKKFPCQGNLDAEFAHNNPDMAYKPKLREHTISFLLPFHLDNEMAAD